MGMLFDSKELQRRQEREKAAKQIPYSTVNNLYVGNVKKQIKAYHKRIQELNKIMDENRERLADYFAEEANSQLMAEKNRAYEETRQSITDIYKRIRSLLSKANYADRDQFVQKDIDYMKSIPLTASELQGMVNEYQRKGNFTQLRWIKDYISGFDGKDKPNPYTAIIIKMPEDILKGYKQYFDSGLMLVEKIKQESFTVDNPTEIESYADSNFGNLSSIVGTGNDLEVYGRKTIPEADMHVFDHINLNDPTTNQYMPSR